MVAKTNIILKERSLKVPEFLERAEKAKPNYNVRDLKIPKFLIRTESKSKS